MKKYISTITIIILMLFSAGCSYLFYDNSGFWKVSGYIDGYWGEWEDFFPQPARSGNHSDFVIYRKGDHPSEFVLKVDMDSGIDLNALKNGWVKKHGTITFYVPESFHFTRRSQECRWLASGGLHGLIRGENRVVCYAEIHVSKNSKNTIIYNIYFNGYAVALIMPM